PLMRPKFEDKEAGSKNTDNLEKAWEGREKAAKDFIGHVMDNVENIEEAEKIEEELN
ncbi:MAG: hypothetical protein ACD_58C00246G0001, partial [uncultured bacterium]